MSKMGAMILDIQEMYANGYSPKEIAQKLKVPMEWVTTSIEEDDEPYYEEEYDRNESNLF